MNQDSSPHSTIIGIVVSVEYFGSEGKGNLYDSPKHAVNTVLQWRPAGHIDILYRRASHLRMRSRPGEQ